MDLLDALRPLLRTARFGRSARAFGTVDSTNTEAWRWAEVGAPHGSLVLAEHQTAGRGRHGRTWADEPGASLLLSLVLRPALAPERLGLLPLAAGVAASEAIEAVAPPLVPALKWPNDVLLGGWKCGGILLESRLVPGAAPVVIVGIGVNVNGTRFPPDVAARATSLALEAGWPVERAPLLAALLLALETWTNRLEEGEPEALVSAFTSRLAGLGEPATVAFPHGTRPSVAGRLIGVDSSGALLLHADGQTHAFHAGEVTLRAQS